ncbi:MAG: YqgE/AlgH family protein, partial [Gammaproteobacteria bacterium]
MPGLDDPNFQKTVTFVCAHSDEGAMGIIINRLSDIALGEV